MPLISLWTWALCAESAEMTDEASMLEIVKQALTSGPAVKVPQQTDRFVTEFSRMIEWKPLLMAKWDPTWYWTLRYLSDTKRLLLLLLYIALLRTPPHFLWGAGLAGNASDNYEAKRSLMMRSCNCLLFHLSFQIQLKITVLCTYLLDHWFWGTQQHSILQYSFTWWHMFLTASTVRTRWIGW